MDFRNAGMFFAYTAAMDVDSTSADLLRESLDLSVKMLDLADRGVGSCKDDGCLVLYGIIRDCAYRIGAGAEKELDDHLGAGRESVERATDKGGKP